MDQDRTAKLFMLFFGIFLGSAIVLTAAANWLFPFLPFFGWTSSTTIAFVIATVIALIVTRHVYLRGSGARQQKRGNRKNYELTAFITVVLFYAVAVVIGWIGWRFAPETRASIATMAILIVAIPIALRLIRGSVKEAEDLSAERLMKPIQPSPRTERKIERSDRLLRETRRHPVDLARVFLGAILLTLATRWVGTRMTDNELGGQIVLGLWVLGTLILIWMVIGWYQRVLFVTNKDIGELSGVVTTQVRNMGIKKVTDLSLHIPWHSILLAYLRIIRVPYGSIKVESAGQDQALTEVHLLPDAANIYKMIRAHE